MILLQELDYGDAGFDQFGGKRLRELLFGKEGAETGVEGLKGCSVDSKVPGVAYIRVGLGGVAFFAFIEGEFDAVKVKLDGESRVFDGVQFGKLGPGGDGGTVLAGVVEGFAEPGFAEEQFDVEGLCFFGGQGHCSVTVKGSLSALPGGLHEGGESILAGSILEEVPAVGERFSKLGLGLIAVSKKGGEFGTVRLFKCLLHDLQCVHGAQTGVEKTGDDEDFFGLASYGEEDGHLLFDVLGNGGPFVEHHAAIGKEFEFAAGAAIYRMAVDDDLVSGLKEFAVAGQTDLAKQLGVRARSFGGDVRGGVRTELEERFGESSGVWREEFDCP